MWRADDGSGVAITVDPSATDADVTRIFDLATAGATTQLTLEEPVLNFANFIEEIAPETLPAFTAETGIAVNYDTYELNQVLESRLLVGSTGLDLVVPSNNYLERQIAAGVYRKLDKSQLPNLKNVDPAIYRLLERNDPRFWRPMLYQLS